MNGKNITIRDNTIFANATTRSTVQNGILTPAETPVRSNRAIMVNNQTSTAAVSGLTIDHNWLDMGGYTLQVDDAGTAIPDLRIVNNIFGQAKTADPIYVGQTAYVYPRGAMLITAPSHNASTTVMTNNLWEVAGGAASAIVN
jgi:hypothetical protein